MKSSKYKKFINVLGVMVIGLVAMNATAAIAQFSMSETLSENSSASKTKLVRLGNGWLISTYGDAAGPFNINHFLNMSEITLTSH